MLSLDQKFIQLVASNDLAGIKVWIKETNNNNQNFIKETDPDSRQYPTFHYSEIQTLILRTAAQKDFFHIIDYILNDPEFKNKIILDDIPCSESPLSEVNNINSFEKLNHMGFTKWFCPNLTYLNVDMEEKLKLIDRLTFYFNEKLNEDKFYKNMMIMDNPKDSNETRSRQIFHIQFQISSKAYKNTKLRSDLLLSLQDRQSDNIKIKI